MTTSRDEEIRLADEDPRKGLSWTEFDTLLEDVMAQLAPADATPAEAEGATPRDADSSEAGDALDAEAASTEARDEDSFALALERELETAEPWDDADEDAPAPAADAPAPTDRLLTSFLRSSYEAWGEAWGPRAKITALAGSLLAVSVGVGSVYLAMSDGSGRVVDASRAPAGQAAEGAGRVKTASLTGAPSRVTVATRPDPAVDQPMPRLVRTIRIVTEPAADEKIGVASVAEEDRALNGKAITDSLQNAAEEQSAPAAAPMVEAALSESGVASPEAGADQAPAATSAEAPAGPVEAPADPAAMPADAAAAATVSAEGPTAADDPAGEEQVAVVGPRPRPAQAGEEQSLPLPRPAPDRRAL